MKINSAVNGDVGGVVESKVNKKNYGTTIVRKEDNKEETSKVITQEKNAVEVQLLNRFIGEISSEELAKERSLKVAEIRRQVQSGEYFSSRSITDIAEILERRMGEEIEITKIFTKDEEE